MPRRITLRREAAAASLKVQGTRTDARSLEWSPAVAQREILRASKRLVRLQVKRRKVRRALDVLNKDILAARRELRAIMGAIVRDDTL